MMSCGVVPTLWNTNSTIPGSGPHQRGSEPEVVADRHIDALHAVRAQRRPDRYFGGRVASCDAGTARAALRAPDRAPSEPDQAGHREQSRRKP